MLLLRCRAEIPQIYSEYTELQLGSVRKDPIPERGKNCDRNQAIYLIVPFLLYPS